jgi:hypothetical protein
MATTATATGPAVREQLQERQAAVRRGEYEILGAIEIIHTTRGVMQFGADGPVVARLTSAPGLALLTDWPGLRAVRKAGEKLCQYCRTKCDECKRGKRACMYTGCGGSGKITNLMVPCPAPGCLKETGAFKRKCQRCNGRGEIAKPKRCPACKGKRLVRCDLCRGSARMATGRLNGATNVQAKPCPACLGNKRQVKVVAQSLRKFVQGELEGMLALGPITSIVFRRIAGSGDIGWDRIEVLPDAGGNLMVLLLERPEPGSPAWLHGGVVVS